MISATFPADAAAPADRIAPDLLKLAGIVMLGALMVQLDSTMVNVGVDTLRRDFQTSVATIQWVSTGYLLAMATVIPLTGWLADRFGARATWMCCLIAFLGGSVLCGMAWSVPSLIAMRVLQGLGGGMILPLGQAVLALAAGPGRIGRLMSAIGVPAMLGPVAGPVLGGVLVDHLSWRWIFYVNVPVCLVALALSWRIMPSGGTGRAGARRLDARGLLLVSPGCAAVVYGLSEAGRYGGFTDPHVLVPLAAGLVLLAAFVVHALRARIEPVIDLRLFRIGSFTTSSVVLFTFGMAMFAGMFLLPLYYQQVRGDSAVAAGLLLAPQGLGLAIALILGGQLADRLGPRWIALAGLVLVVAGTIPFCLVRADSSQAMLIVAQVVRGLGLGATLIPCTAAAYRGLPQQAVTRASSATRIFQQLGGSFGVAVVAVVVQHRIDGLRAGTVAGSGLDGLAGAFGLGFWWTVGFCAVAVGAALRLPRSLHEAAPARSAEQAEPATAV